MVGDKQKLQVAVVCLVLGLLTLAPVFTGTAHCEPLVISQSVFVTANVADLHSTYRGMSSGHGVEGNPVMGDGTGAQAVLVKSLGTATVLWLTHQTNKSHPTMTRIALYSMSAVIAGVAYRNYRIAMR